MLQAGVPVKRIDARCNVVGSSSKFNVAAVKTLASGVENKAETGAGRLPSA